MNRSPALLLLALTLAACGSAGTAGPSARPTASALPSPVTSAKGAITVTTPRSNETVSSPVTISGDASVFEANVLWRIVDASGRVIVEGLTTASLGAPGRGTFSVTATYSVAGQTAALVEVYSRSPKDGSIDEIARLPVTLR